jgi:hypothetical protein
MLFLETMFLTVTSRAEAHVDTLVYLISVHRQSTRNLMEDITTTEISDILLET